MRCGYDAQGNLTTLRARDRARTLAWNRRGLLVSAVSADGTQVTFGYDAFGRRIRKRTIGTGNPTPTETRYWWAGEQLIAEAQWEGQRLIRRQEYGYLPGTTIPFATRIDGQVYYYHCDHLGTPRHLTNAFGEVVWAVDYDAFGQARIARDLIHNPLRFAGQYHDPETGWHYNRFRYYSPELGRYLSRDPIGLLGGTNLYAYVDANPLNRLDPQGLWWKAVVSAVAAVAVGVAVVALAPVALPTTIILGGAAAGAVGFGLINHYGLKVHSLEGESPHPWTSHGLKVKGLNVHSFNYDALRALKLLKQ